MNWLHYLIEANLYLGTFYLCYCLFLNRETHYNMNRAYLLFSCLAAFILPVVQLGVLKPPPLVVPVNYKPVMVSLQRVSWAVPTPPPAKPAFIWSDMLLYTYLIGAGIFLLILLLKLYKLARLAGKNNPVMNNGYNIVYLDEPTTAFSFFKYLFIGTNSQVTDTIIRHELVHIKQKHSADILFIELLKIVNWFNPFIYLIQRSLRAVHEYIADEQTASAGSGALAYSSFLVENAYGLSGASVTHSFFNYNLLKKRIIMLHQKRSGKLARLKYLLTVPVCAGLLCASTLAFSKDYGWVDLAPRKMKNVSNITSASIALTQTVKADTVNRAKMHRTSDRVSGAPSERYHFTGKGYRYNEMIYFINGKGDYRVLIWDKNNEKEYWKSKTSAAEAKILKNKYGYTFPDMPIYSKLPPPPPMVAPQPGHPAPPPPAPADGKYQSPPPVPSVNDHKTPPPPPAPPIGEQQPPAPPAPLVSGEKSLTQLPEKVNLNGIEISKVRPDNYSPEVHPLLIVNGTKYYVTGKPPVGYGIIFSASDSSVVFKNKKQAVDVYGNDARNGVLELFGKVSAYISINKVTTK
ncbi:MAG: M56 family metallopeptidase [Mucilaginibacter sp.]